MKKVYAIHAKKRCGKDTVATMIQDHFGKDKFHIYSLAAPIKEALVYALGSLGALDNVYEELGVPKSHPLFDAYGEKDHREFSVALTNADVYSVFSIALSYITRCYPYLTLHTRNYRDLLDDVVMSNKDGWSLRKLMTALGTDLCAAAHKETWIQVFYNEVYCNPNYEVVVVPDVRQEWEYDMMKYIKAQMIFVTRPGYSNVKAEHSTERGLQPAFDDIVINNNKTLEDLRKVVYDVVVAC